MRQVKDFKDVNIVLKELLDWRHKISNHDNDFHLLRIRNASPGVLPNDYAVVSQLPTIPPPQDIPGQHYTIVWTSSGIITTGMIIPGFVAGKNRDGLCYEAILSCEVAPTGGDLTVNIQISGVNILNNDLKIVNGTFGPVSSGDFKQPVAKIGYLTKPKPIITNGANASIVTVELIVVRN